MSQLDPYSRATNLLHWRVLDLFLLVCVDLNERYELGFPRSLQGGGKGLLYIGGSINSGPSDQTNLKGERRCNLRGGGELTYEGEPDR